MIRGEVPTPALILDLDILESNIAAMVSLAGRFKIGLRPHAKSHKCVEIARRLCAGGALGASCATVREAEVLAAGGIAGILITSPIETSEAVQRLARLFARGADLMLVADHSDHVGQFAGLALQVGRRLPVLIDFDVGQGRTGCLEIADALTLARRIAKCSSLRFAGVQAYWGQLQHVPSFAQRQHGAEAQAPRLTGLIQALKEEGMKPEIVTGGGTGTHLIDAQIGVFTELQPGSFLFVDSVYSSVELTPANVLNPFRSSLFVTAAVISANRANCVIVNAGFKAIATDSGQPIPLIGAPPNATYRFMGDEHGAIEFMQGPGPRLGSVIELLPSRSDTTVNLHDHFYVVRDDRVLDEWSIAARGH